MLDRGIRVGMGTDGPASNDGLDLFADLRLAASLARLVGRSATALTAAEALWLATGAAADAIGRPDLGQLEAGRRADLVHVDTRNLAFEPVGDATGQAPAGTCATSGSAAARSSGTSPPPRWTPRRYASTSRSGPRGSPPAESSSTERLTTRGCRL
jgi:cytosine/adenosine deaminase-related metal-dependent hydrolase